MKTVLLTLLVIPPGQVHMNDLDRFPSSSVTDRQLELCQRWKDYLDWYGNHQPNRRQVDQWIAQIEETERYWLVLQSAHWAWRAGPEWKITTMFNLHQHLGSKLYRERWYPCLIPENCPAVPTPVTFKLKNGANR